MPFDHAQKFILGTQQHNNSWNKIGMFYKQNLFLNKIKIIILNGQQPSLSSQTTACLLKQSWKLKSETSSHKSKLTDPMYISKPQNASQFSSASALCFNWIATQKY